ncbi:serine/threonine-protein kinase PDIK1L isoform X3 [Callithrix jacchus]
MASRFSDPATPAESSTSGALRSAYTSDSRICKSSGEGGGERRAGHAPDQWRGTYRLALRKAGGGRGRQRKGVCPRAPRGRAPAADWRRRLQRRRELPDNGGLQSP